MDKFWIEKARRYIEEHNAFESVSNITYSENPPNSTISAIVTVGLPSKFIKSGITNIGVKSKEEVQIVFDDQFPLRAPTIVLRNDFPRCFPHINPSESKVIPCIYEGNLSELLQQSEWMNGVLNQLVDWLEKAASNELLNYDQGWEPMRNDYFSGFMLYDLKEVKDAYSDKKSSFLSRQIYYEELNNIIVTGDLCNYKKRSKAHVLYFLTLDIIFNYLPNSIIKLSQLYEYANLIGIQNIKKDIEDADLKHINEDKLFVVLSVKRPINIINSNSNIEFLNFIIHKSKPRKGKKRVLPDCKVGMLLHIADKTPSLLKRLSGTKTKTSESKSIALVGCGSLGSKIGMHLARNGNGPFLCIDNDIFLPHNNARHALTLTGAENKADLLSLSIFGTSKVLSQTVSKSAVLADFNESRLIIDTTASLSVKQFLMSNLELPPIISCGLYGQGRHGITLFENESKTVRLTDLWAHLYYRSLSDETLRKILFSSQLNRAQIGQSCSSQTMIVDDSRISIMAATMGLKIQNVLEESFPANGECLLSIYDDNYSLSSELFSISKSINLKSSNKRDWEVYLSESVLDKMREIMIEKKDNETGGVLLGTVFLYPKIVVVTGIQTAPPDSIEKPNLFILGIEGLEDKIKKIEKRTNGKVTYLGTWHSHPQGGSASETDNETFTKLLFVRNYEPTVCLIITKDEVILV